MQALWQDLRFGARMLLKNPGFTVVAVVTLALGIGANTAIFSVANAVLLRPLPYKNPDRLVLGSAELRQRNVTDWPLSNTDVFDLRNGAKTTFEDIAALNTGRRIMPREDGAPEPVRTASVTPNFFRLLGAKIVAGRDFTEDDGRPQPPLQTDGAQGSQDKQLLPTIAILSHEYWQRRYGGNTAILGKGMLSGGSGGPQIVGVLAPGFELLLSPKLNEERLPDVWFAARLSYDTANRNNVAHRIIGRLKDGARLEQARTEAEVVAAESRKIDTIRRTADFHFRLEPMDALVERAQAGTRFSLLLIGVFAVIAALLAGVGLYGVLSTVVRQRTAEIGVRMAMGATPGSVFKLVVGHGLRLSAIGVATGVVAAFGLTRSMTSMLVGVKAADPSTFVAMAALFLIIAAIASGLPARRASGLDPTIALREE